MQFAACSGDTVSESNFVWKRLQKVKCLWYRFFRPKKHKNLLTTLGSARIFVMIEGDNPQTDLIH
jgi:hypothetical protein